MGKVYRDRDVARKRDSRECRKMLLKNRAHQRKEVRAQTRVVGRNKGRHGETALSAADTKD